ncbi:MAG: LacI family DNA-binding transcriptional regulator [Hellea sp.]
MTTIIDVAKKAGVSFKTVSRVLNGEAGVREKTRENVLNVATELNYQPNSSARNLRAKTLPTVALLGDNPSRSFVEAMRLGAIMGCKRMGYNLKVENLLNKDTIEGLLSQEDIVGAVLAPPLSNSQWVLDYLNNQNIPYVRICAEQVSNEGHKIGIDDRAAARDMTQHLIDLGHKRIGFIKGHSGYDVSRRRVVGYKDAMDNSGIEIDHNLIVEGEFSYVSGLVAAEKLLAQPDRPTAIFASNDDMAAATLAVAYKYGISVPDQLSIAGFDDSPIAKIVHPGLTTIRQAVSVMAEKAIDILAQKIIHKDGLLEDVELLHELVERASTAPMKSVS